MPGSGFPDISKRHNIWSRGQANDQVETKQSDPIYDQASQLSRGA